MKTEEPEGRNGIHNERKMLTQIVKRDKTEKTREKQLSQINHE